MKSSHMMRKAFASCSAITALAFVGLTLTSQAVVLQFFGEDDAGGSLPIPNSVAAEADFLSNLTGVGTENFDSVATGSANGLVSNFSGVGSATFSGSMSVTSAPNAGRFAISGSQYITGNTGSFSITFSAAVAAFGFYATDAGDFGGMLTLSYANAPSTVININQQITSNGNAFYFGYINTDNPFTSVSFANSAAGTDSFGFDNMTIGSVQQVTPSVPDGGTTFALLGLAISGIFGLRKKFAA